jgi:hypothetical protein
MCRTFIKIVIPPVFGIAAVILLLMIYNLITYGGDFIKEPLNGLISLVLPLVFLTALAFQLICVVSYSKKIYSGNKIWGLNPYIFAAVLSILSGAVSGLFFYEHGTGLKEKIYLIITGIILFATYIFVNFITTVIFQRVEDTNKKLTNT